MIANRPIWVPGPPVGMPAPRATARLIGGKPVASIHGQRKHRVWDFRRAVVAAAQDAGWALLAPPVSIELLLIYQRPKAHWKVQGGAVSGALKDRFLDAVPEVKPDCSNVLKAVEDALSGVAFEDDAHVSRAQVLKMYETVDRGPGALVTVKTDVQFALDVLGVDDLIPKTHPTNR